MSRFSLFRTKMDNEAKCRLKFEQRFMFEGASATDIHIVRLSEDRSAYIVMSDAEGPDSAIVFTPKQEEQIKDLHKSDYFIWQDKLYFVYEDVMLTYDATYIKQKAYQCNIKFMYDNEEVGGYFISSLRKYVDTDFQKNLNITDKEQPLLIIPLRNNIKVGTKLSIGNKPWKVIDIDHITNSGILYISLDRDFYLKSNDIITSYTDDILKAGIEHSFITSEAYFITSTPLNIKLRTENKVVAVIPYGVTEVDISTKIDGQVQTQKYKVEV